MKNSKSSTERIQSSSELFDLAKTLMPGGVSSPVRAIKPYPFYTERAEGSHLETVDGRDLLDCCMAYGPLILGHAHPAIRKAIGEQLERGWLYGTPTPLEPAFAKMITGDHPLTALEIARELGITSGGSALTGQQITVPPHSSGTNPSA